MQFVLALLALAAHAYAAPLTWVHPGVLISPKQLALIRTAVANRSEPFYSQYQKAIVSWMGQKVYVPQGPPASGVVECGSYSVPDYGCSAESRDATTAYMQAVLWAITSDRAYANNSMLIMDTYARNLKGYNNSNAPLQAAWTGLKFARAAEIIRHTGAGWPDSNISAFAKMLVTISLKQAWNGWGGNGNWELSMLEAMIGTAVFTENATMFDRAVGMWRERVPAYLYYYLSDGGTYVRVPSRVSQPSWYNQVVFNASTSGMCQETCRDLGHTGMGMASMINLAETAWIQGLDLYREQRDRLVTALEFNMLPLFNNESLPMGLRPMLCGGGPVIASGPPLGEIAYNHYARRMGLAPLLNNTWRYVNESVRPRRVPSDCLIMQWEPLTHSNDWNASELTRAVAAIPASWATPSVTASITPTPSFSASTSIGASSSPSRSATATSSTWLARFAPMNIVVLRGGTSSGAAAPNASLSQPLSLIELHYQTGDVVSTVASLPVAADISTGTPACTLPYQSSGYQLNGFAQRSWDASMVVFPCNDLPAVTVFPNNVSGRVIGLLRADGSIDLRTRVTTAFRDSASATTYRTVASMDGSSFYMTGSTSSTASDGLHYAEYGSSTSRMISDSNAVNQRYVTMGRDVSAGGALQLFISMRDPVPLRGISRVGSGLPTATNLTLTGTDVLPGFAALQPNASVLTAPLIGSFVFEDDGRTLWTADTQSWNMNPPPSSRPNLVQYVWNLTSGANVTSAGLWTRGIALELDPPSGGYSGNQVVHITGRFEDAEASFMVYATNSARIFRVNTRARTVSVLALAPAGTFFYSTAFAPFRADIIAASPTASRSVSATPTRSATGTSSRSGTLSPTVSISGTASRTPTSSATGTVTCTSTGSVTPAPTLSATITPTGSLSGTISGSWTSTPTASLSSSFSGTASASQSLSGTAAPTDTSTASGSAAPTPSGSSSPSPTASVTRSGPPSASRSLSGTSSFSSSGTATPPGSISGTTTKTVLPTVSASRSVTGTTSGSRSRTRSRSKTGSKSRLASLSKTPTLTASRTQTRSRTRKPK